MASSRTGPRLQAVNVINSLPGGELLRACKAEELPEVAKTTDWEVSYLGACVRPRGQEMLAFVKAGS